MTEEADICPDCGAPLASGGLAGLCSHCLLAGLLSDEAGAASVTNLASTRIDRYTLIEEIGEGGMGSVWRARQEEPVQREVALKLIKLGMDTRAVVSRFENERQVLASLDHAGIAKVFDAGTTEAGRPYFVMELVDGVPVTEFCERHQLDLKARLALIMAACDAVSHAHQKGIIHRDLKPSNVLVDGEGRLKVIDFGVAKATADDSRDHTLMTRQGQFLGTPGYMSPEQASGEADVDTRSDIYALGALLYEILAGGPPFDPKALHKAGMHEILRVIREEEPPRPSTRITQSGPSRTTAESSWLPRPGLLKGDLDRIVMQSLAKERERRYRSADALREDLRRHLEHEPISAAAPTLAYRSSKFARKHRIPVAAAILVVLALLIGGIVATQQAILATRASKREAAARNEIVEVVVDMHRNAGLKEKDPSHAALWFANAAKLAEEAGDPDRASANRIRWSTWTNSATTPLRAVEVPLQAMVLEFHSSNPFMLVHCARGRQRTYCVIDWEREELLDPGLGSTHFSAAALHPQRPLIAASDFGGKTVVWNIETGKIVHRIDMEKQRVSALAWSSQDHLFVGSDKLRLWDLSSGDFLREFVHPDEDPPVRYAAFSSDGSKVLSLSDKNLSVYPITVGSTPVDPLFPAIHHRGSFRDRGLVDLSPEFLEEGNVVRTNYGNGQKLRFTNANTGEIIREEVYLTDPIDLSPDGRYAAISSGVYERKTGTKTHPIICSKTAFTPDSLHAVTGQGTKFHLESGKILEPAGHRFNRTLRNAISPGGLLFASSESHLVRLWRMGPRAPIDAMKISEDQADVAFSPDSTLLAGTGTLNGFAPARSSALIRLADSSSIGPRLLPDDQVEAGCFTHDNRYLVLAAADSAGTPKHFIQVFDVRSATPHGPPIPLSSQPRGVTAHPDQLWVALVCESGEVYSLDPESFKLELLCQLPPHPEPGKGTIKGRIFFTPDQKRLLIGGKEWGYYRWNLDKGAFDEPFISSGSFSRFDQGVAADHLAVNDNETFRFWNTTSGKKVAKSVAGTKYPVSVDLSPSGDVALISYLKGGMLYELESSSVIPPSLNLMGQRAGRFVPDSPWIIGVADERWLSSNIMRFRIWDRRSGHPVAPAYETRCRRQCRSLSVAPNGRYAGTHSTDAFICLDLGNLLAEPSWNSSTLLELAELNAGGRLIDGNIVPFSAEEWLKVWRQFRSSHPDTHPLEVPIIDRLRWHRLKLHDARIDGQDFAIRWHEQQLKALEADGEGK